LLAQLFAASDVKMPEDGSGWLCISKKKTAFKGVEGSACSERQGWLSICRSPTEGTNSGQWTTAYELFQGLQHSGDSRNAQAEALCFGQKVFRFVAFVGGEF
jgi:hypothetical protein